MTTRWLFPLAASLCLATSTAFGQQSDTPPEDSLATEPFTTSQPAPERTPTGYSVSYRDFGLGRMQKRWTSPDSSHSITIEGESDDGSGDLDSSKAETVTEVYRHRVQTGSRKAGLFGWRTIPVYATVVTSTTSTREFIEPVREPAGKYAQNWPRPHVPQIKQLLPTNWVTNCTDMRIENGQVTERYFSTCNGYQPNWPFVTGTSNLAVAKP